MKWVGGQVVTFGQPRRRWGDEKRGSDERGGSGSGGGGGGRSSWAGEKSEWMNAGLVGGLWYYFTQ